MRGLETTSLREAKMLQYKKEMLLLTFNDVYKGIFTRGVTTDLPSTQYSLQK